MRARVRARARARACAYVCACTRASARARVRASKRRRSYTRTRRGGAQVGRTSSFLRACAFMRRRRRHRQAQVQPYAPASGQAHASLHVGHTPPLPRTQFVCDVLRSSSVGLRTFICFARKRNALETCAVATKSPPNPLVPPAWGAGAIRGAISYFGRCPPHTRKSTSKEEHKQAIGQQKRAEKR